MNSWGYAITSPYGEVIRSDFGYESEQDAEDALDSHMTYYNMDPKIYTTSIEQRWIDI